MDKACKIGFGSFFLLLLIAFAIIVGVYFTQEERSIIGTGKTLPIFIDHSHNSLFQNLCSKIKITMFSRP